MKVIALAMCLPGSLQKQSSSSDLCPRYLLFVVGWFHLSATRTVNACIPFSKRPRNRKDLARMHLELLLPYNPICGSSLNSLECFLRNYVCLTVILKESLIGAVLSIVSKVTFSNALHALNTLCAPDLISSRFPQSQLCICLVR